METTLAILMILGIFVGIPAVIGFAIAGGYIWNDRRVRRTGRNKAVGEAEGVVKKPTKEHVLAA